MVSGGLCLPIDWQPLQVANIMGNSCRIERPLTKQALGRSVKHKEVVLQTGNRDTYILRLVE